MLKRHFRLPSRPVRLTAADRLTVRDHHRSRFLPLLGAACWAAAVSASVGAAAERPDARDTPRTEATRIGAKWVRVLRDDRGRPIALETAVVRYVPEDSSQSKLSVDLVGAVHVADRAYYEELNQMFRRYDALLYELVAPEGTEIKRGESPSHHPVGILQNVMKEWLELEHQLACIDYTKTNFVHADMSPQQLAKAMSDRGESILQMFFRLLGQSIAQQSRSQVRGNTAEIDLVAALFDENRAVRLKTIMAEQFEEMESMLDGLGGVGGSTLIEGRNRVALEVLGEQIKMGKDKLGVFYGAGHLANMDKQLRKDFGLRPVSVRWLTAWDLRSSTSTTAQGQIRREPLMNASKR